MAVLAHAWRRESSKPFADGVPAHSYERGFERNLSWPVLAAARNRDLDVCNLKPMAPRAASSAWSSRHAWAAHNPAIEKTVEPSTAGGQAEDRPRPTSAGARTSASDCMA